ncbi:hypothetical protein SPRG_03961 [Saprolegnia parasitica CBS 223.65]|uniref:Uncharacterized protein n=1 Tax=Saprolegnia parasitica (strain CBS 223.65) TaxID=695850 RepID=A0A067CKV4_SAPPC|nr:hypothetical protein SPRG_03961 [Saprolegnia parasitica CBS 223.65]KDO31344.1 hypothetical protein SPRG_03961 [Saprolegnia parasitica CBS 223.65]|eukprot:XP_012197943.1 hypothetical protein SPRG_03961 [Saprolegnia parasitica CBS 223.65]
MMRRGVRRRREADDEETYLQMPAHKKSLVEFLENMCISSGTSSSSPATKADAKARPPSPAAYVAATGPRQFLHPQRVHLDLYTSYLQRRAAPPRDPALGALVLYNPKPKLNPMRSYMFPPFTIPEESEIEDSDFMTDVDMESDDPASPIIVPAPGRPRPAGNLSHSEWFLSDESDDDNMDLL